MKKLLYLLILVSGFAYGQTEPINPESVTTDQISPISTSGGLALKNNAGTSIAIIGVGSSSSTNSTWTGNIVQTGTLSTQALTATNTTNQFAIGTTNVTTLNFPAPSGSATLTFPLVTSTLYGTGSGTITSSEMATSLSDETGSGALVFGTSPTFTTGITTANLTATGTRTFGANGRTLELNKTVTLTDEVATTIATITLPTGSNLAGVYTVKIEGFVVNQNSAFGGTGSDIATRRFDATVTFGQDNLANSATGFITTSTTGNQAGDALSARTVDTVSISASRSGTDNSVHAIQINANGTSSTTVTLYFVGEIKLFHGFTSLSLN